MRGTVSMLASALALVVLAVVPGLARAADPPYGIERLEASLSTNQAGAHPDFNLSFAMNHRENSQAPVAATRDIEFELPPGLLGYPSAAPRCTTAQLVSTDINDPGNEASCPQDSQVGVTRVQVLEGGELPVAAEFLEPVYNMVSPGGDTVAQLGFMAGNFPTVIDAEVRSESDYGVTAKIQGIGSFVPLLAASTTLWGVPASESHDGQRLTPYEGSPGSPCGGAPCTPTKKRSAGLRPAPFMANPTTCAGPLSVTMRARSYLEPGAQVSQSAPLGAISGCGALGFAPSFTAVPTNPVAKQPTGLNADLSIPQDESPGGRDTAQLKNAVVTLPRGMTIASGAGAGLEACSASEAGYGTRSPADCPDASKIGTATIDVPALDRPLEGAVYQRTPETGDLFRLWLIVDDLGLHLKIPGDIQLDGATGQVTSLFLDLPQAPVREVALDLKQGSRAPLANPACGTRSTHYEFTPNSGGPTVSGDTPMQIDGGCGAPGFDPQLSAGTTDPTAGGFSSFLLRITQADGEQNMSGVSVQLPEGLLARPAAVSLCPDALASSGGCPSGSQIGTTTIAAGPGQDPLWIPQPGKEPTAVYLAGPYGGAPYSLVVKVPAQAGPFDLGTVVTRVATRIDPVTAQITAISDPLPQILDGVPVTYRTVSVDLDHPDFTLNPTSCAEKKIGATLTSVTGAVAAPSQRFQAANCASLPYKPAIQLKLRGGTKRSGNPALTAILRPRPGDANSKKVSVALPHSEFLDQAHIKTICTRVQFNAGVGNGAGCPAASIYGHVKAWTPLLPEPLEGPVFLRSSEHPLPDLVLALRGLVDFTAVGRIDSVHGGIRNTFESIPDAPITKVEVSFPGGKKSLLENSTSLCLGKHKASVAFGAHSGKQAKAKVPLQVRCGGNARKGKRNGHSRRG